MDLKQLYALMERFEKSTLSELTFKKEGEEVTLKKGTPAAGSIHYTGLPTAVPGAGSVPSGIGTTPQPAEQSARGSDIEVIRAPIVGTFYRSPAPDAAPFVEKGDRVKKGQTLCILEAMKLMNEFQAEYDLEIIAILADNGTMVEYGTPLFEVRRT
jgi:acetyl-CoA carboxylase biotin carboxyl carrier protein